MNPADPPNPSSGRHDGSDEDPPLVITPEMLHDAETRAETRVDFERGMSYGPPLTLGLMFANVAVFAWELNTEALESAQAIIRAGALHRESVLNGELWRLVSAMFLHGGFDHLLGNCLVLYIVGLACEHAVGTGRTATLYFASGLGGGCLSLIASPGPSVGASGAIFGLTGALIAFLYRHRDVFYLREKRTGLVLGIWSLYQIATGFLSPLIDNFAHLGGLATGAICVWSMRRREAPVKSRR